MHDEETTNEPEGRTDGETLIAVALVVAALCAGLDNHALLAATFLLILCFS